MGLGLTLRARATGSDPLLAIEQHIAVQYKDLVERTTRGDDALAVQLHPAAEDIEFTYKEGEVLVSAKTSTAGPGYHAFVCDLLRELGLEWDANDDEGDETGYFASGDRDALESEMLAWLRGVCGVILERVAEGSSGFMISLPLDAIFEFEGAIATPMGPRDVAWLRATHEDPRSGIDMFPWWEPGFGAHYRVGRALTLMWTEVRWRRPMTEDEEDLLAAVDNELRIARDFDRALALPQTEWAEIERYLDDDNDDDPEVEGTIGYRRRPVRVALTGGWTVQIPGEMGTQFDEEGTWNAYSPGRAIWMSSFRIGDPDAPTKTAQETLPDGTVDGERLEIPDLAEFAYRAYSGTTHDGDAKLTLEIAQPQRFAVFTFIGDGADDIAWAIEIAASVRHP